MKKLFLGGNLQKKSFFFHFGLVLLFFRFFLKIIAQEPGPLQHIYPIFLKKYHLHNIKTIKKNDNININYIKLYSSFLGTIGGSFLFPRSSSKFKAISAYFPNLSLFFK